MLWYGALFTLSQTVTEHSSFLQYNYAYLSFLVSASESVFFKMSSSRAAAWVCCSSLAWSLFSSSACPSDLAEEQKDKQVQNRDNFR